jgi:hypothetical protein
MFRNRRQSERNSKNPFDGIKEVSTGGNKRCRGLRQKKDLLQVFNW